MDNELFELCKEVYEKTKWGRFDNGTTPTDFYYSKGWNGKDKVEWAEEHYSFWQQAALLHVSLDRERAVPLYTSDYLLEKLPKKIKHNGKRLSPSLKSVDEHKWWLAQYYEIADGTPEYNCVSDTPLKSLLKLTIALHEAGELSNIGKES